MITPEELVSWVISKDDDVLVLNKPAHVLSHPSKHGPWSSLVGASRTWLGAGTLHMVSRLDRETSGLIVLARRPEVGSLLQKAMAERLVRKRYLAVLAGSLKERVLVEQPIGPDPLSSFVARQWVVPNTGRAARTWFEPIARSRDYTLVSVRPETGRRHQIRVHASWMGHAVLGDKLYGPDATLMPEFIRDGFTERLRRQLILDRHALHACELTFDPRVWPHQYEAPLTSDLQEFLLNEFGLNGRIPETSV
jgi:23S rRNA pseudouridine1911/1915/1917 synthase